MRLEQHGAKVDLDKLQQKIYETDVANLTAAELLRVALECRRPPRKLIQRALAILEGAKP